jgi:exosome complex RNA-binding protein Rrp4
MRRWVVDISSVTQASLQLSAVDLPGGIQRRRTTDDELMMRDVYREGDVIAAEVCASHLALHMKGWCQHMDLKTVSAHHFLRKFSQSSLFD